MGCSRIIAGTDAVVDRGGEFHYRGEIEVTFAKLTDPGPVTLAVIIAGIAVYIRPTESFEPKISPVEFKAPVYTVPVILKGALVDSAPAVSPQHVF